MPRIKVTEKDLSWYYRQRSSGQIVVLVPGVSTFGPVGEPVLVNADNFKTILGASSVDPEDLSYNMTASFVTSGADVLFWRIPLPDSAVARAEVEVGKLTYLAKYPGSYGNDMIVKTVKNGDNYRVLVYHKSGSLLENLLVNFNNPDSPYYYESVMSNSNYIEFDVTGKVVAPKSVVELAQGSDGTYSKDSITDYLASSDSDAVIKDLSDMLSYDFNLITSGGYNSYLSRIEEFVITSESKVIKLEGAHEDTELKVTVNKVETEDFTKTVEEGKVVLTFSSASDTGDKVVVKYSTTTPENISQIDDKLIYLAEKRGTAIYLVDGDKSWDANEFYAYTDLPQSGTTSVTLRSSRGFDTSYAAAYGPWVSAKYTSNGVTRVLPGSYALIISWAQSLAAGSPIYFAPAGVKRATLNFVNNTVGYQVGSAVLDLWQNQEVTVSDGHKINPIMELKQYGYTIYGNSTLLKNQSDGATSMLQSFSTRVVANLIKTQAFNVSLTLQFDQLDSDLFAEFKTLMSVFMDQLKYDGALYDYRIIADRSTLTLDDINSRTVPVKIQISPNPAVENFDITLEISQAGVTFTEDDTETAEA